MKKGYRENMKKIFIIITIIFMLVACGGESKKPQHSIVRTDHTEKLNPKPMEFKNEENNETEVDQNDHQEYKQQVFVVSFMIENKSPNADIIKKIDKCKIIVPKLTPFSGELLYKSNECSNLSNLDNLLVKKHQYIRNAVSISHDLIFENENGSRTFQVESHSGLNFAQIDYFDQFYSIKDNNIAYIKSEKELAIIDLKSQKQETYPVSVDAEIKSIGPLTEDGLCYLFTDTEMLTYDLKSKSIIKKVKFLELPFENNENSWYPLFMPYKIYDSENDCFYVFSHCMEPESVDSVNSKMLRITTIDKTRKPKTIYELSNSSFSRDSMDVSFLQSDKYVVCTMNNAAYDQNGQYTVLVVIDKHTGTVTELRIKKDSDSDLYLNALGINGSKLVTRDHVIDMDNHSISFKQKNWSIARFFDNNLYAFEDGILAAINFDSIEPAWKMKFSKEAKLLSSLGQENIVIADGNQILFINPAKPEAITTFEYDMKKIVANAYGDDVGFFLDEGKNKIFTSQGECFGQREPGKLYINPMKLVFDYGMDRPSELKAAYTTLLWTGDKPIQAELKYDDLNSNASKMTIDLKPGQKKEIEVELNRSAKILCNGETYNLVFISQGRGD